MQGDGQLGRVAVDSDHTVISKRSPIASLDESGPLSAMEMGLSLRGQYLNHFQLGDFVGGGGMGAVFRAVDTKLDRIVAIKILARSQTDEDALRRFRNEAQSAARLDHPNIARVYDVGDDKGWNYIVFEFIEGTNIRDLVEKNGQLSLEDTLNYTLQVGEALEHASHRDVVHRDIKPSNVLVMPDGRVKLVDMGLARLHQVESPAGDLTASGVTLGTFDYISPEQAYDPRSADVRSDIYSLGCTLYFMLTGRPPFPEGTAIQKLLSHTSDQPPDARLFRPKLPDEIVAILTKMLAKDPQQRYQEPSELIGALLLVADQLGLQGANQGGKVWITPTASNPSLFVRSLPVIVSLVALFTAVFVVDYLLTSSTDRAGDWASGNWATPVLEDAVVPAQQESSPPLQDRQKPTQADDADSTSGTDSVRPESATVDDSDAATPDVQSTDDPSASDPSDPTPTTSGLANDAANTDGDDVVSPRIEGSGSVGLLPPSAAGSLSIASEDFAGELLADSKSNETDFLALNADNPVASLLGPISPDAAQTIIVGADPASLPYGALMVGSLKEAVELAAKFPNLRDILLRFNGSMEEQPFSVAAEGLTIRASQGYTPTIVFRPFEPQFGNDRRMVRVQGGSLIIEDVHWRMELPTDPEDNWSLFHFDRVESVEFRRCTLTIENVDSQGSELQDRAAFFEIEPLPPTDIMSDEEEPLPTTPSINLYRCIARGRATLLRVNQVSPIVLNWEQGLFISSQRLVEVNGAMAKPRWGGAVRVELTHVTVASAQGLCVIKAGRQRPNLLPLDLDTAHCVFLTDPSAPLIEHLGVSGGSDTRKLLKLSGDRDYFPYTKVVWQIVPEDTLDEVEQYDFDRHAEEFPDVHLPGRDVMWRGLPTDSQPVHRQTKSDYLLSDHPSNVAARSGEGRSPAGFDPDLLTDAPLPDAEPDFSPDAAFDSAIDD